MSRVRAADDPKRAYQIAGRLEAGTVWINKHLDMTPRIPFGGAKQSGLGVEFGEEAHCGVHAIAGNQYGMTLRQGYRFGTC